jgi:uncharacterized RDD family membrane protein YckC
MNAIAHASALSTTGPQLDNRRVLAALIDLVIVGAGAALILFAADALPSGSGSARDEVGTGLYLITLAWALYYYFACESGGGQTLGKRVMKLRVVRVDGSEAGMREIAVRTILRVVDGICLYLVGLIVMLASGKRRQRLGDMAGGTIVVDANASPEPQPPVTTRPAASAPIGPAGLSMPTVTLPEVRQAVVVEEPVAVEEPEAPVVVNEPVVVAEEPEALVVAEEPERPVVAEEPEPPVVAERPEPPVVVDEPEPPLASEEPVPVAEAPAPADPFTPFQPIMHEDVQADVVDEQPVEEQPVEEPQPVAEEPPADEPVVVRSVETVSAMDLVMGDEDDDQDPSAPPAGR